ncbi:hypothetical protein dsmv_1903 [Desulfococcus multivorans DSM 2059]|uniref:Uncharacterized protein n=1 Tax=Desulfococcus multivorans DSM 2059 TaxID=1121405 RepID=S7V5G9_DESML|nr:hypothetical protein dsmv_1903 [Desulfococcus multivorans DSM 2059]SJZ94260.1 hypothetical protein SAMN02745446_02180 [Desulfococcus multivorans DSM 2059]
MVQAGIRARPPDGEKIDLISEKDLSPHLKPLIEKDIVLLYEED